MDDIEDGFEDEEEAQVLDKSTLPDDAIARDYYPTARKGETLGEFRKRSREQIKRCQAARKVSIAERKAVADELRKKRKRLAAERTRAFEAVRDMVEAKTAKRGIDLSRDIVWVYRNMGRDTIYFEHAPSVGAVELLNWVLSDDSKREHFYKVMLPKALAMQEARQRKEAEKKMKKEQEKKEEEERGLVRDMTLEDVERMLRVFEKGL